jgi:hypothetical protein
LDPQLTRAAGSAGSWKLRLKGDGPSRNARRLRSGADRDSPDNSAQAKFHPHPSTIVQSVDNVVFIMRVIVTILGVIAILAFAGFVVKGTHQKAAICDTADCPASECP